MILRALITGLLLSVGMRTAASADLLPPAPRPQAPDWTATALADVQLVEQVAARDAGRYTSLQLDTAGRPHISYYDVKNGDLKYAYKDSAAWHVETVDSVGNVGGYTSLALDALEQPNISYCELVGTSLTQCDDLKYAIKLHGVWHYQTVDCGGNVGAYSSLAVEGGPSYEDMSQHISYYDQTNQQLKYCWGTGAMWACDVVDNTGNVGGYTSLALDALGQPNISYCRLTGASLTQCDDLKYAIKLGGTWHYQTVDSVGSVGAHSSLAVEGGPSYEDMSQHISYYDQTNQQLKYCWGTGAMWKCEVVDSTANVGGYTSLALDTLGQPNVSYCKLGALSFTDCDDLKYAVKLSGTWHYQTVDSGGKVGAYSSLVVEGGPSYEDMSQHISYYDQTNQRPKYCWASSGKWRCGAVVPPVFLPLLVRNWAVDVQAVAGIDTPVHTGGGKARYP
jgi:hypothetical protein